MSTRSRAGCPARSMAWRIAATSLVTPVEVSLCTTPTARIRWEASRDNLDSTSAGSTPRRQSPGTSSTSSPRRRAIWDQSNAKCPVSNMRTRSPGESVFTQGRFPGAGPGGGIEKDRAPGLKHFPETAQDPQRQLRQFRSPMVLGGARHGAQDPFGNVGGTWGSAGNGDRTGAPRSQTWGPQDSSAVAANTGRRGDFQSPIPFSVRWNFGVWRLEVGVPTGRLENRPSCSAVGNRRSLFGGWKPPFLFGGWKPPLPAWRLETAAPCLAVGNRRSLYSIWGMGNRPVCSVECGDDYFRELGIP